MTNKRRAYSPAEELCLTTQVGGICPCCGKPLFYAKRVGKPLRTQHYKGYELAHIYPLNPKPQELVDLAGVELPSNDVNDPTNLIPLCTDCHSRFDKPRTLDEYEDLAGKKRQLLEEDLQKSIRREYPIETEIHGIVTRLFTVNVGDDCSTDLEYDPKQLAVKFDASMPPPTQHKIRSAVSSYYGYVKTEFAELERNSPTASTLIFAQVRTFYIKQKKLGLPQGVIFKNVTTWISERTTPSAIDAVEIVASFFVQNCEVFE